MPKTDIPKPIQEELNILKKDLDKKIPPKKFDKNLLIATWNIKEFGDLNDSWVGAKNQSPKRDMHSLYCIKEIISRFDIVAVQEVTGNLRALRHLMKLLGAHWSFLLTDNNKGSIGGGERFAFLFDTRKVKLSGLACEISIPDEYLLSKKYDLSRQFARSPYGVGFNVYGNTFVLLSLHIYYGDSPKDRYDELGGIAKWAKEWALELKSWEHSLFVLGDFNIDRKDDPAHKAFTSTGLYTPEELETPLRGIAAGEAKFYDQISWFREKKENKISMEFLSGGSYDFKKTVLISRNYKSTDLQWRISDHLPLWAEFKT
ncbi:MAG: endonuclease/exonuclease/phosphatase family protein [Bacteroidota bacterium]